MSVDVGTPGSGHADVGTPERGHGNVVPPRVRLNAKLPAGLLARLDARARRDGQTRTAVVEAALRRRPRDGDLAARCRRVGELVRAALTPGPATPAAFLSVTLEAWLRAHADDLGAAALDDLVAALDSEAELSDTEPEGAAP